MSSRVSIRLVGFVAVTRLSLTVWHGKHLFMYEFELFAGSNQQTKSYNGNKAYELIEQVDQVAENVLKMQVLALTRQTNKQVEWILD